MDDFLLDGIVLSFIPSDGMVLSSDNLLLLWFFGCQMLLFVWLLNEISQMVCSLISFIFYFC